MGVDCGGLILGVGKAVGGLHIEDWPTPVYSTSNWLGGGLYDFLREHMDELDGPDIGSVLLMSIKGRAQHVGLKVSPGTIVHARELHGVVEIYPRDKPVASFDFRQAYNPR